MMMKIKNLADIVFFSANRAVDYMIIKWDFQVIGKHHRGMTGRKHLQIEVRN